MPKGVLPIEIPVPRQGFIRRVLPHKAPADSVVDGQNMLLTDDDTYMVRPGYLPMATTGPGGRILGIFGFRDISNAVRLVAANRTQWWSFDFGTRTWTNITGTVNVGDNNIPNRFVTFLQANVTWLIGVNGIDKPHRWNPAAATYVDIADAPICRDIEIVTRRAVTVHTTESGTQFISRIRWSAVDDVTSWPANAFIDISDAGTIAIAVRRLSRNSAVVYRQEDAWLLTSQPGNDQNAFRIDSLGPIVGPCSPSALLGVSGVHYYLGVDSRIYRFDGVRPTVISDPINSFLQQELITDFRSQTHCALLYADRRLCFFFAATGAQSPRTAVFYHLDTEAWDVPQQFTEDITASTQIFEGTQATWASMTGTWNSPDPGMTTWESSISVDELVMLLGTGTGQVHRFGRVNTNDDNGTAIVFNWTMPIVAPNPQQTLLFNELESYFTKATTSQSVTVAVNGYLQPLDPSTSVLSTVHTISTGGRYRAAAAADFVTYYPGLQVTYSGTTSNNKLVEWGGGVLFISPEEDAVP